MARNKQAKPGYPLKTKDEIAADLRALRVKIDSLRLTIDDRCNLIAKSSGIGAVARYMKLAITNIEAGCIWLGQVLKGLDTPNPYPESKNSKSAVIEPTADAGAVIPATEDGRTLVAFLKDMRRDIDRLVEKLEETLPTVYNVTYGVNRIHPSTECLHTAQNYLTEAGMWLGKALSAVATMNAGE